jgi:predicted metal-dependent hydrolase
MSAALTLTDDTLHELVHGDTRIPFTLLRSRRKTLGITVKPSGAVQVTAPAGASLEAILRILQKRRLWILSQQEQVAQLPTPRALRRFVSGESCRYLGRQYRLKIQQGSSAEVRLSGGFFQITVPDPEAKAVIAAHLHRWMLDHARVIFERRMKQLIATTPLLAMKESPPLLVRRLQTRWGSCSPQGRILMNLDSIQLPVTCIDYILMHELCHLRHPNHGKAFWNLLDRCLPGWEERRKKLDAVELE